MRKNYFLSAALIALTGFGLVGCSDNPDRITNVNEVVKELVDFGGYTFVDKNANGIVDAGEALSGVRVTVKDPVTDKSYYAESDANGRFDFSSPLTEGSYNVSFTDSAGTVNGAIVSSVEYYHAEAVVDLTQPGDGSDGTPEQGAVSANFGLLAGPVMIASNFGDFVNPKDISSLTEVTFTFNKPVTVINDPVLVDASAGNAQVALTAEGTSAAAIKASTILTSSRTTVAYTLPTLTANHAFTLDWNLTDYKATDNGEFGAVAPAAIITDDAAANGSALAAGQAIAGSALDASGAAQTAAVALAGRVGNAVAGILNTGTERNIVTTANTPKIESVVVQAAYDATVNTAAAYSQISSKYAIFAPQHDINVDLATRLPFQAAGHTKMATSFAIQLSNVKSDLEYTPVVSYDGGTVWYIAGNTMPGSGANANGSLTINTTTLNNLVDSDLATRTVVRPYYLVKGFYNTSTTDGQNYTRLKVAVGRTGMVQAANNNVANTGLQAAANALTTAHYSAVAGNTIDKNTERASDTWVNIFDGDLTDYKNRGFSRTLTTSAATQGNAINGIPGINHANYRGSSYPLPLVVDTATPIATPGFRNNWFAIVEDHSILTDLVEPDGDARATVSVATDRTANGWLATATYIVLSGIEEAASATLNANDAPNPTLGTKATHVYVYFNEPMDSTTITSKTNWLAHAGTSGVTAPTVSSVEYSEAINTSSGKEVFRAKVTLSAALVANQKLMLAAGALVDKNGNYPVLYDSTKPTSYITVFNN